MANRLYVFYPTDIRPKKMEKHISKHCPDIKTTVFAKYKDFNEQSRLAPPDAILSFSKVIQKSKKFSNPHIQGFRNGVSQEKYLLVSVNEPVDMKNLEGKQIGAIDMFGRRSMKEYFFQTLGAKVKVARVTKTEDILNLLTFKLASAIFISEKKYQLFKKKSKQTLIATDLDINMDLVSLAVADENSKQQYFECVKHLDDQTNALLGVDSWQLK